MGDTNWVKNFTPKADGDAEWAAGMRYLFDDATRMSSTCRKPSSASCVVRNLATRTACVSLRRAMNPVAASRRISPKPASGVQRHWESFKNKE